MTRTSRFLLCLCSAIGAALPAQGQNAQVPSDTPNEVAAAPKQSIFNGRNLAGWRGDPRLWQVENGVIVGRTESGEQKIAQNSFLIWEGGEPADFELTLKARITGSNNSGVQYRSRVIDLEKFIVGGYQMDMHPNQPYLAMLYEEKGRGIVCHRGQAVTIATDGAKTVQALGEGMPEVDLGEWNDYRIEARGAVVTHWVNGRLAARIEDHEEGKKSTSGVIALQLHAGQPMKAEFKDVTLRQFPSDPEAKASKEKEEAAVPTKQADSEWVWSREEAEANEEIFLRRSVSIPQDIKEATLIATADNSVTFYIDGKQIAKNDDWKSAAVVDVTEALKRPGRHVLAARAHNSDGEAGFAMRLELTMDSGETEVVVSDRDWKWRSQEGPGWNEPGNDQAGWMPVVSLGKMGTEPWGNIFVNAVRPVAQTADDVSADFNLLPGFTLEKLYQVPATQGSWVALTRVDDGRLIASDQYGKLFRITPPTIGDPDAVTQVRPLDLPIEGAQGLLWAHDALYVATNSSDSAVFRITDGNGDGELDQVEKLKSLVGSGEHGPHGLVLSPDGKWIYLAAGNHTDPLEVDASLVPPVWGEDQLLPSRPDARGHARTRMAPGGWVARFTPDGKHWELVSVGYRNAYGLAFNHRGDLFTYDSDMEWDFGTPWYRPTRVNHITSGSEYGWRNGTAKWPAYYEDSLPAVLDIGPGSPTGVVAGEGLRFPARYQHAIYILDWTFATIYAVHLTPDGASYSATTEELISGNGLPVTDATVGADGALYFTAGGRRIDSSLFRIVYTGNESTKPAADPEASPEAAELTDLRRSLEELHRQPDAGSLDRIWAELDHEDRFIRFAARVALEHLPVDLWKARLRRTDNTEWQAIQAAIALARHGSADDQSLGLGALARVNPAALEKDSLINLMRAYGLVFARHNAPSESRRDSLVKRFDPLYPASDDDVNRELCRLLVYLESPNVVTKTLRLMAASTSTEAPAWADLASRNSRYGESLIKMIENMPPTQELFYAYSLRAMEGPWTEGQRRQFFEWFNEAAQKSGGNSYQGFLEDLRKETLKIATPEERSTIEGWNLTVASNPFADLPEVKGPGRAWTVDEAMAALEGGLTGRDRQNGKRMYEATLCSACHRFGGEGGGAGPDLSAVGGRFTKRDLMEAIIHPEKEVSDQYRFDLITMTDGSTLRGKILEERDADLVVTTSPFDFSQTREVPQNMIELIEPAAHSPMPGGLINRLNEDELRDLVAFLLLIE